MNQTDDEHNAVLTILDPDLEQLAAYPSHSTTELAKLQDGAVVVRSHSGIVLGRISPENGKAAIR